MKLLSVLFFLGFVALSLSEMLPEVLPVDENADISRNGRIVNGQQASLGQFPYHAVLKMYTNTGAQSLCGGSIISPTVVLTAAHCVKGFSKAVIGIGTISSTTSPWIANVTNPAQLIVHPSYDPLTIANDIAVIIVPEMPINGGTIAAIALPSVSEDGLDLTSKTAFMCGFGRTITGGATSSVLLYTSLPLISNAACAQAMPPSSILSTNICTSGSNRGICNGDSGGAMTTTIGSRNVIVGITSFLTSAGCAVGVPSAFTRVSKYLCWINSVTGITIWN